ncbi:hypothetical protein XELAEV_18032939mg [Xenopus laevis]|uniref:Peptidase M12B propeptide domain-containing protein n=1 Tax=Xenopus laevis TaxID=8355 RepID=A0A974CJ14_XENLA|nr:hypothetical protein XELAEV_18032939mg [Xenopus laevis]
MHINGGRLASWICCVIGSIHLAHAITRAGNGWMTGMQRKKENSILGMEDTVPLRLIFSNEEDNQTTQGLLSTRVRAGSPQHQHQLTHVAQASFQVDAFGSSFILDVELNHDLLSSDYRERHVTQDGKTVEVKVSHGLLLNIFYAEIIWSDIC